MLTHLYLHTKDKRTTGEEEEGMKKETEEIPLTQPRTGPEETKESEASECPHGLSISYTLDPGAGIPNSLPNLISEQTYKESLQTSGQGRLPGRS